MGTRILWLGSALCVVACNTPVYVSEHRPLNTGMTDAMGALLPDTDLFVIPVRQPTRQEARKLIDEQTKLGLLDAAGAPAVIPWAGVRDFDIQIQYSIKNLETTPVTVTVSVNGGNEFGDYDPAAYIDPTVLANEQPVPPQLLGGTPVTLKAGEVRSGIFREDELVEAARDLEAIVRYPDMTDPMTTPYKVIERRSSASTVGLENIPASDVLPAMVRIAFTVAADGRVVVDYNVRVRDHNSKLMAPPMPNNPDGWVSVVAALAGPYAPMFMPPANPPTMTGN